MTYRILLVDDEPAALLHLKRIIEKKCPAFAVAGMAENALQALEEIRAAEPDVVISDVRMPRVSGVELARIVREEFPDIYFVIVSGYSEFEYAKKAMQAGVNDYILKPVVPFELQAVLERLLDKIRYDHWSARKKILHRLCSCTECGEKEIRKYFSDESYYGVLCRRGGLPRRFSTEATGEIYSEAEEQLTLYGRDEQEAFYLIPEAALPEGSLRSLIGQIEEKEKGRDTYLTVLYDSEPFTLPQLPEKICTLYQSLNERLVVGRSQRINLRMASAEPDREEMRREARLENEAVEKLLRERHYGQLREELRRIFGAWIRQERPQLYLEQCARQMMCLLQKYGRTAASPAECEYMLEDAFYYAPSGVVLAENLCDVFSCFLREERDYKADSPEFFAGIVSYLEDNLREEISLQGMCERFGITQTYLSRIFRKYTEKSFGQYLTFRRMERAKQIMEERQLFYIKDIAELAGYRDQFYFSRIFRTYTGMCPSEYMEKVKNRICEKPNSVSVPAGLTAGL